MGAILAHNAVAIAFIIAAGVIAVSGHDGWGWCILGAILTHVVVGSRSSTDDE